MSDPIIIKVTTKDEQHSYFVHFDRDTHELLRVQEYRTVRMSGLVRDVVAAARTKLTPAPTGDTQ